MLRQLVVAIFENEAAADAAVEGLDRWAGNLAMETTVDAHELQAVGIMVLDEKGKLRIDKAGPRSTIAGAGIGVILAMLTPVGMAVGIIGGGILGALHHKRMWISDADRERIGRELTGGKAAVGVVTDKTHVAAISAALTDLGGVPESHELDDAALAELDAAAAASAQADPPGVTS